jgi:DNA-binding protein HU-beta
VKPTRAFLTGQKGGAIKDVPVRSHCASQVIRRRKVVQRHQTRKGAPFVNKSEMIDAIARHADISKAAAGRALDATVTAIKSSLKKGDIVTLVGFGSFYVGRRNSRAGRNPRTGDAIKIEAAKVPKFRAGKALKDELN